MATSTSRSPGSGSAGASGPGTESIQNDSDRYVSFAGITSNTSRGGAFWLHVRSKTRRPGTARAPSIVWPLPGLPGLPGEHLPVAHGRGGAAGGTGAGGPGRGGDRRERGHRGLARGGADIRAGPGGARPARLRRVRAPGPPDRGLLAGPVRPAARDGREQPRRPAPDGPWLRRGRPDPAAALVRPRPDRRRSLRRRRARPLRRPARRVRPRVRADPRRREGAGQPARRVPGRATRRTVSAGDVTQRLARLAGAAVSELRLTGSQHQARHYRATLADGRVVFVKEAAAGPAGPLNAEARGLGWLGAAGAVPVPGVVGWDESLLVISWVPPETADAAAAGRFGRDLARMHAAGADRFGAPWPGFIASLPLPNDGPAAGGDAAGDTGAWPEWYASRRLVPYLRRAADAGALGPQHLRPVEAVLARITELAGPAEPPSRIHGDCWSGNVLWSGGRGWLIDPAAHGGHRETDLAMLALFGAPFLDRILASYDEAAPLAAGWRARVPLHQLHPLLVHACLFGAGYAGPVAEAARAALAA